MHDDTEKEHETTPFNPGNRRICPRYEIVVPVQIATAERKERLGVTRDVSDTGALFFSNSRFAPGERLEVTFIVSSDGVLAPKVRGEVVRSEERQLGMYWRYAAAMHFDRPLPNALQIFSNNEAA